MTVTSNLALNLSLTGMKVNNSSKSSEVGGASRNDTWKFPGSAVSALHLVPKVVNYAKEKTEKLWRLWSGSGTAIGEVPLDNEPVGRGLAEGGGGGCLDPERICSR